MPDKNDGTKLPYAPGIKQSAAAEAGVVARGVNAASKLHAGDVSTREIGGAPATLPCASGIKQSAAAEARVAPGVHVAQKVDAGNVFTGAGAEAAAKVAQFVTPAAPAAAQVAQFVTPAAPAPAALPGLIGDRHRNRILVSESEVLYFNVGRIARFIEEAISKGTKLTVFDPDGNVPRKEPDPLIAGNLPSRPRESAGAGQSWQTSKSDLMPNYDPAMAEDLLAPAGYTQASEGVYKIEIPATVANYRVFASNPPDFAPAGGKFGEELMTIDAARSAYGMSNKGGSYALYVEGWNQPDVNVGNLVKPT